MLQGHYDNMFLIKKESTIVKKFHIIQPARP